MKTVSQIVAWLDDFAPGRLAEPWDNVGLLMGDPNAPVRKVMTCLTITRQTAEEAVAERAEQRAPGHRVAREGEGEGDEDEHHDRADGHDAAEARCEVGLREREEEERDAEQEDEALADLNRAPPARHARRGCEIRARRALRDGAGRTQMRPFVTQG